jgi:hypothetical protein
VTFSELPPAERVALAEHHVAQLPPTPGAPTFGLETLEIKRKVQLALCDDSVSDEQLGQVLAEWRQHLQTLAPHIADEADLELREFAQIAAGLRGPEQEEEAAEEEASQ